MPKRPNILLITSDQQHYDTLGVTNPHIRTPALDRLASQGVRFDRAYCSNPTCTPARASIITGLYPSWHGAWTIGVKLPEDVPTVGDALHRAGYYTALVGKCHLQPTRSKPGSESIETPEKLRDLDFWRKFHGPFYGFQNFEMTRGHADEYMAGAHYALWMEEKGFTGWRDHFMS
ncbi:MAG TPA: sulfatase-like hydrolase/transferase, partial [Planctomycetota bacterium]|nr:sulfatase-like hydrolase/transferase [Planctomycetota bacterium]